MTIAALIILLVLSAFFSSAETVLFSLTRSQRAHIAVRSPRTERRLVRCLSDKAVLFSTLLVGNTFVNFAVATIGYRWFSNAFPAGGWLAIPVMTVVLLVFGEIVPKRLGLKFTEELVPAYSALLIFWRLILTPFNWVLRLSSRAFSSMLESERRALSDEELVSVMAAAAEGGEVTIEDAKMVEGVLRLSELCANDEMTPRVDIEGIDCDRAEADRLEMRRRARHRYLPVYRRTTDAIEGIFDNETGQTDEPLFVPETVSLDDLLVTFARSRKPLAVVLDEYGGTAGLITQNDVLELIMGPRIFASPDQEPEIRQITDSVWEIDARASLDEINRALGLELEAEDADRLSGWVQFHAERLPHIGQQIEADGCRATVLKRRRRRVTLVRLEILSRPEVDTDEELIAETDEAVERTEEDE